MTFISHFVVEGIPVAKGRPRFSRRGNNVVAYTPAKTKDYEVLVKEAAVHAMGSSEPIEGAVALSVRVFMPIPASWSKRLRASAIEGDLRPIKKPDADNYAKAVMDACNTILYLDDSQVVDLHASKEYSTFPRIEVTLVEVIK